MNRRVGLVLGGLIIAAVSREASAADCKKWITQLRQCEVLPNTCIPAGPSGTEQPISFGQRRTWYSKLYVNDPQTACKNWRQYGHPEEPAPYAWELTAPDTVWCSIDDNGNGLVDDPTEAPLYFETIPKQSCCSRVPQGPNSGLTPDGAYQALYHPTSGEIVTVVFIPAGEGHSFSFQNINYNGTTYKSQIDRVRSFNKFRFGSSGPAGANVWRSDLHWLGEPEMMALEPCANGDLTNASGSPWYCRPEVHHMIPKTDVSGCDCGSNTYANALLISAQLNRSMSNDCEDPRMVKILDRWAPLTLASNAGITPNEIADATDEEEKPAVVYQVAWRAELFQDASYARPKRVDARPTFEPYLARRSGSVSWF